MSNNDNDNDYEALYKVILIGDSGVGKTNILSRYIYNEFKSDSKSTIGVEFTSKRIKINNTSIKVQIWDTAGHERYRAITNTYYKGSNGCFIVYDITNMQSFENIDKWYTDIEKTANDAISIVIVGNKCDLENERKVPIEMGKEKAKELGACFFETSALSNINIENIFIEIITNIHNKQEKKKEEGDSDDFYFVKRRGINLITTNTTNKETENQQTLLCC